VIGGGFVVTDQEIDSMKNAETLRLEAETAKLNAETEQTLKRLNKKWYQEPNIAQYVLATVIATAVLFAWYRTYMMPILEMRYEIAELSNEVHQARVGALAVRNDNLKEQRESFKATVVKLVELQKKIEKRSYSMTSLFDQFTTDSELSQEEIDAIEYHLRHLSLEIRAFFSIWNSDDPIMQLENYGWSVQTSNKHTPLGHYKVINQNELFSGEGIFITYYHNLNDLRRIDKNWQDTLNNINDKCGCPIIELDNSYYDLYVDPLAKIGGTIYTENAIIKDFHEPLKDWLEKLGKVLK
jgi:hypothetical protein